ncbi:XdhC family protein [Leptolyngbya cf. ectocarpi LEGE 11479]|uniref:XdhC family protein n=1 Tax=Leptolyngbya cf. ectocarpi LEGE 11479 TaxID=1828722 RepID=A0A929A012_LEPEC|nr:XdhC family protein [Leptolyngbya ectocarpi]MBE9070546.1 XdhC family protein [Leptolyngbya cf. ectocarpi LEGE 11479]
MIQTTISPKTSSLDLFSCLLEQLSQGPVVLAIVTATQGQVASQVGDKLLVWGDAQSAGSLTEHTVKATVIAQAFEVLKTGLAQRMVIDPGDNMFAVSSDPAANTSINQVHVWLTRWQGEDAIATAQATLSALKTPQPCRLMVPLVTGQFPHIIDRDSPSLRNLQGQDAYIEEL